MLDIDKKICYICEKENADSVDHIPPRNIFISKYLLSNNLMTVPAHIECNILCSKDDDYFRIFLLIYCYWTSSIAKELWNTKVKRQLNREQSKMFKSYLSNSLIPTNLYIKNQSLSLISLESDRVLKEVARITRGIYYYKTGKILKNNVEVEVDFNGYSIDIDGLPEKLYEFENVCDGIFKFAWVEANDKQKTGIFKFIFYNSIGFCSYYGL